MSNPGKCKKISLFGNFGWGNLGNSSTLEATLYGVRRFLRRHLSEEMRRRVHRRYRPHRRVSGLGDLFHFKSGRHQIPVLRRRRLGGPFPGYRHDLRANPKPLFARFFSASLSPGAEQQLAFLCRRPQSSMGRIISGTEQSARLPLLR